MIKSIQIGYNESFEKKCRFASESGFRHISVNLTEIMSMDEYVWEKATEDILKILQKNNLECVQSHPFYYPLDMSSELLDDLFEFVTKQAIIASGKLSAPWCALHPRSSVNFGFSRKRAFEDNKRAMSVYLECAKKYNTGIAAENLPIFPDAQGPMNAFYSSNYEDLCELVDSFNDESVGICWDTGHANLVYSNQADVIKYLSDRIKCTHIHNNHGNGDYHMPPDSGNIDWNNVMQAFKSIGYEGPFTLETHCLYPDDFMLKVFAKYNYGCLEYLETLLK